MPNTLTSRKNLDRRAVRRYDLCVPIEVRPAPKQSSLLRSRTRDVSTRGVFFVIPQELPPGSLLDFSLTLPGDLTRGPDVFLHAHGRVVRTERKTEGGIQYIGIGASIETYNFSRAKRSSR